MGMDHINLVKYNELVKHFHNESDRSSAIVLASFLEVCLEQYLMSFMVDDPKVEELFEGSGTLSTFKSCIDTAYAFGFITSQIRDDLTYIRKLRNHFAHHPDVISFSSSPVCDWCKELSFSKESSESNPKSQFLMAVGLIIGQIHNDMLSRRMTKNN